MKHKLNNKIFLATFLTTNLISQAGTSYNPAASASSTGTNSSNPFAGITKPAVTLNLFGSQPNEGTWDTIAEGTAPSGGNVTMPTNNTNPFGFANEDFGN